MHYPDWRFKTAQSLRLKEMSSGIPAETHEDFGVRKLKLYLDISSDKTRLEKDFPEFHKAFSLYKMRGYSSLRDMVEAMILGGASDNLISEFTNDSVPEPSIRMYEYFFFNVKPIRDIKPMVETMILSLEAFKQGPSRISGYVWKIVAYYLGLERFFSYVSSGESMSVGLIEDIKRLSGSAHARNVLHYVLKGGTVIEEDADLERTALAEYVKTGEKIQVLEAMRTGKSELSIEKDMIDALENNLKMISDGDELPISNEGMERLPEYIEAEINQVGE